MMVQVSDPSIWLSMLCRESWDLAKRRLREDPYRPRIVSLDRQDVLAATNPRSGGDVTGKVLIKVHEGATGSVTSPHRFKASLNPFHN